MIKGHFRSRSESVPDIMNSTLRSIGENSKKSSIVGTGGVSSEMELVYSRAQIKKIIDECRTKTLGAQKKANLYRTLNILTNLFIVVSSIVIGIIETQRENKLYSFIVLSFLVALTESLYVIFRLGQRGVYFKHASIKYQKLLTLANETLFYSNNRSDLQRLIHQYRGEMDELSYSLYKVSYGPDAQQEPEETV